MARRITADGPPFAYRGGNTVLRRLPAGFKLFALFVFSALAFSSVPGFLLSFPLLVAASRAARVRPGELLRGSRSLVILSLFVLVFKTVEPGAPGIALGEISFFGAALPAINIPGISAAGFKQGLVSGLRLLVSFAAGALLFAVTTMRELRLSLGRVENAVWGFFTRGRSAAAVRQSRLSLGISLMLGFIPRFFEAWETANLACDARAGRRGIRRLALIIPLVSERMMELAADTADALEARGIGLQDGAG
jgi:biotin transport system permease protein